MKNFKKSAFELIKETSVNLPSDVRSKLSLGVEQENPNSNAGIAMSTISLNIDMAVDNTAPICQDTGMPTFIILVPPSVDHLKIKTDIKEAIAKATKIGYLRPNAVDPITGKNSGNNLGDYFPVIHIEVWDNEFIEMKLLLKGGGCENKNIQYSLPCNIPGLGQADRNLEGIRKCILHSVYQAQGHGCSTGFIGVGIGGDRTSGYELAKMQLFRNIYDVNLDPKLAQLEDYILNKANKLDIGPMGFKGKTTLLSCKIGKAYRLPASFFVSVAYDCWAYRRLGININVKNGQITKWLYRETNEIKRMAKGIGLPLTGNTISLKTPITKEQILKLKVGDLVNLNGEIHTGRDTFHHYIVKNDLPKHIKTRGGVLYHCGPVVLNDDNNGYKITAAGPTTSIREEPYQSDVIKKLGLRAVIGKGGMGDKTLAGLKQNSAVYLNAIGGAAQYYANCIKKVTGVDFLKEMGSPEAMWHLQVSGFLAIVTMDAHGNSLHKKVDQDSFKKLETMAKAVF